jgi:tRNA pseudouridine32 synthase / 23S rRNA pseudouridine746 synthase
MDALNLVDRVLYRDGLMLVLNKPPGIAVHRGPKGGESLEDYFGALRFGLPRDPALAHRLDRDTSGCLVLGRHRKALEQLGLLFKHGRIKKVYWALVCGDPSEPEGLIDLPLARLDLSRGWWMKVDPLGAPAKTRWRVRGRAQDAVHGPIAWLEFEPLTGRTHQLRVHAAAAGWPILGDPIYGTADRTDNETLHLLARQVAAPLHKTKDPVVVTAPAPAHMLARLRSCGWREEPQAILVPSNP